jgi:L-alanine-DL-glutamate epimerase-like enolase superfamily enzyme
VSTIVSIETFVGPVCFVRVRTDDGLEGYGQTAHSEGELTAQVLHRLIAPHYLGKDPINVAALADSCARESYKIWGSLVFRALAGVDTALWDLLGKASGRPVYQLLGGKLRDRVPLYGSAMKRDTSPEEEVERVGAAVAEHGFGGVKIKIGERIGRDGEPFQGGRSTALIPALRAALGDQLDLSADGNGAYSPGQAIRIGRVLEEYGYYHFEEPTAFWEHENTKEVADALDIPVAAGEQEFSVDVMRRLINQRVVDIIQPDVCYIGGVSRAMKVAQLADLAGIPCIPHSSGRSLTAIFTAHLVTAMPACTGRHEWTIEDVSRMRFYEPFPVAVDGHLELSDRPGWGVEIDPDVLRTAGHQVSTLD